MSEEMPPDDLDALIRRIDDLLGEAAQLREEAIVAGRERTDHPFWPDRRRTNRPHFPERRAGYR